MGSRSGLQVGAGNTPLIGPVRPTGSILLILGGAMASWLCVILASPFMAAGYVYGFCATAFHAGRLLHD
jgi:hypothetical protein